MELKISLQPTVALKRFEMQFSVETKAPGTIKEVKQVWGFHHETDVLEFSSEQSGMSRSGRPLDETFLSKMS